MSQSTNTVRNLSSVAASQELTLADAEHPHPPLEKELKLVRPTLLRRPLQNSWAAPVPYWQAQNGFDASIAKVTRPACEMPSTETVDMFWNANEDLPPIHADSELIELVECLTIGDGLLIESELAFVLNCQIFNSKFGIDSSWKAVALSTGRGDITHVLRYENDTRIEFFDAPQNFTSPSLGHVSFERLGNDLMVIVDEMESATQYVHDLVLKYWAGGEFVFCLNQIAFSPDSHRPHRFTATIPHGLESRLLLAVIREDPAPVQAPTPPSVLRRRAIDSLPDLSLDLD